MHTAGDPFRLGFQNGYLLAAEIRDLFGRVRHYARHTWADWGFFRETARSLYQGKLPSEYREEIEGILAGLTARGVSEFDLVDLIALNGYFDTTSYYYWQRAEQARRRGQRLPPAEEHGGCSAFMATGSWTRHGGLVVAHNTWVAYMIADWRVLLDIVPSSGHRLFMQCWPGTIHSGTDFYLSDAGLVVTETTITGAVTMRPEGTPSFIRSRQSMQYADSLDDWMDGMRRDNSGSYANGWMVGDTHTGEIALLELATMHEAVEKTSSGYLVGCNVAQDPAVRSETLFNYNDATNSCNVRWRRWHDLVARHTGSVDVAFAKEAIADHLDLRSGTDRPSRATLCGHVDLDADGLGEWDWGPCYPGGAIDGIVTDGALAAAGRLWAHWGKPCGTPVQGRVHLEAHPEHQWQEPWVRDLDPYPWTLFEAGW